MDSYIKKLRGFRYAPVGIGDMCKQVFVGIDEFGGGKDVCVSFDDLNRPGF